MTACPSDFVTQVLRFLSEEKRTIHAGDRNGDKFNRQKHTTHNGIGSRGRENEPHSEKLRRLRRRRFPGRKQYGQYEHDNHPVQYGKIELLRC